MAEIKLKKPILMFFYGFPGAGKSFVAKNIAGQLKVALVSEDALRRGLFTNPQYNEQENQIVRFVSNYLTEQLLKSGSSVVYDANIAHVGHRRNLRNLATKHKAENLLVWVQIDPESALLRVQKGGRRRPEDKKADKYSKNVFDQHLTRMQNPKDEAYVVVSGKHSPATQKSAILSRLYQIGLVESSAIQSHVAAPGLINLVPMPNPGRVDLSRRNITIS